MGNEQQPNERKTSGKPANSKPKIDQVAEHEPVFQMVDLSRLIWTRKDGQKCDVWSAETHDFETYVSQFGSVTGVDSPFDRLDYMNGLYDFCLQNHYHFPFTIKPVEQPGEDSEQVGT